MPLLVGLQPGAIGRQVLDREVPQQDAAALTDHESDVTGDSWLDWAPEGVLETVGSLVGLGSHAVKKDLQNLTRFHRAGGVETGAWRGDIPAYAGAAPLEAAC